MDVLDQMQTDAVRRLREAVDAGTPVQQHTTATRRGRGRGPFLAAAAVLLAAAAVGGLVMAGDGAAPERTELAEGGTVTEPGTTAPSDALTAADLVAQHREQVAAAPDAGLPPLALPTALPAGWEAFGLTVSRSADSASVRLDLVAPEATDDPEAVLPAVVACLSDDGGCDDVEPGSESIPLAVEGYSGTAVLVGPGPALAAWEGTTWTSHVATVTW